MKLLHTADLHLGQIIYQNYDRSDEHRHFFRQLEQWCRDEQPDALVVSGDVFDIQQPSATVKKVFTEYFVRLHQQCPDMHIVITAGNHDSASRLQADSAVWQFANAYLIGIPPALDSLSLADGWQDQYIIRLRSGYIVALPYMAGERKEVIQSVLDKVAEENTGGLPVVLMAHQAVTGLDIEGHSFDVGTLKTLDIGSFGHGFDYLALGHIHKPQTIGCQQDAMKQDAVTYPSPVVRYSGSALHVSCDETYPHSVSKVEISSHGGSVVVSQLRIDEYRHFYVLPTDDTSFTSSDAALDALRQFIARGDRGYVRFRFDQSADLPSNFSQQVYDVLQPYGEEWRYNPKMIWTGEQPAANDEEKPVFEVAELQQMTDPMAFVERTQSQYPGLDLDEVRQAFEEVRAEMLRLSEARQENNRQKKNTQES
jgi:exonuclease SbcD